MGSSFRRAMSFLSCRIDWIILAVFWTAGLLLGTLFGVHASENYFLLMRTAASTRVSIVGLLATSCFPFLLSAYAVYLNKPRLICLIGFCKAVLFASCGCSALSAFGSAGWLVRLLLQFSDLTLIPLFCWFSIRHIRGDGRSLKTDTAFCVMAAALVGSIDYCLVSPFLAMLIEV